MCSDGGRTLEVYKLSPTNLLLQQSFDINEAQHFYGFIRIIYHL